MKTVSYYSTFEERELEFRNNIHSLLPRKYLGPSAFWKDMGSIIAGISNQTNQSIAYISSDPKDGLAYSFVDDLLGATKLLLPKNQRDESLFKVIEKYSIAQIQGQKIHTLSGGEVVRLALAKNDLLSTLVDTVAVSSPLTWLSTTNRPLYESFLTAYDVQGKNVSIFSMKGEDDTDIVSFNIKNQVESEIIFDSLKIKLSSEEQNNNIPETWAIVEDTKLSIISPCLFIGDNGAGKSLIAKALSNAISHTGDAKIRTRGYLGKSRLLFQDVIMQTMLRPFSILANSAKCVDNSKTNSVYQKLVSGFVNYFQSNQKAIPYIGEIHSESKTLLEYKFMHIAIRICSHPAALILDEPDWGLSKESAIAFVNTVVECAHDENIPIILISHKKWWNNVAKTYLEVTKNIVDEHGIKYKFNVQSIYIEKEK